VCRASTSLSYIFAVKARAWGDRVRLFAVSERKRKSAKHRPRRLSGMLIGGVFLPTSLLAAAAPATTFPDLPGEPRLDLSKYPTCQKDWMTTANANKSGKMQLIVSCIDEVESFNQVYLKGFPVSVSSYSKVLTAMAAKYRRTNASNDDKQAFDAKIQSAIDDVKSGEPGNCGADYNDYYTYLNRYKTDVKVLTASWDDLNNQ
jgi:hypothetical protein